MKTENEGQSDNFMKPTKLMTDNWKIADFMGLPENRIVPEYHCSWNSLMPVVNKDRRVSIINILMRLRRFVYQSVIIDIAFLHEKVVKFMFFLESKGKL